MEGGVGGVGGVWRGRMGHGGRIEGMEERMVKLLSPSEY